MEKRCQHCHTRAITRPRQLCHRCFRNRAIRVQYRPRTTNRPNLSSHHRRLAPWPTSAAPGSLGKVLEMAYRRSRGWALFHPHDAGDVE